MSDNQDRIQQRKQSLLSELESIKDLLHDETANNIPILKDAIIEDPAEPQTQYPEPDNTEITEEQGFKINLDELDKEDEDIVEEPAPTPGVLPGQQSLFGEKAKGSDKKSLQDNPFLPPHIRQRLGKDGNQNPSTPSENPLESPLLSPSYTEQLIEQLVAEHLPKIEAELRQRLKAVVKLHHERMKK